MAIAFGIFAIIFALLAPLSSAGDASDQRAAPFCLVAMLAFLAASVALGLH